MRIAIACSLLFGAALSSAALAQPSAIAPGPNAPAAPSSQLPNPEEVICKNRVATGSRLAYARDCHTRAEWQTISRTAQDFTQGIQLRGFNLNNCPMSAGPCSK